MIKKYKRKVEEKAIDFKRFLKKKIKKMRWINLHIFFRMHSQKTD